MTALVLYCNAPCVTAAHDHPSEPTMDYEVISATVERLALLVIGSMALLAAVVVTWFIASEVGSLPGRRKSRTRPPLQ